MRKLFYENVLINHNFRQGKHIDWVGSIGKIVHFVYDDIEGDITILDYDKNKSIVTYLYKDVVYSQTSTNLKECQLNKMLFESFKYNIGDVLIGDKDNQKLKIMNRQFKQLKKQRIKIYTCLCLNCGFTCNKYENDLNNTWCPCCSSNPKVVVNGINDIPTQAPWMIDYFQGGYGEAKLYSCQSAVKIYPKCPLCGCIKNKKISIYQIYNTRSIGCCCGDGISYPNKFMHSILKQLNIEYMSEYSPSWLKDKRYDFYIPHLKIFIEMDGELGHGKTIFNSHVLTSEEIELRKIQSLNYDNLKDDLAVENGCEVVRIDSCISNINYLKHNILQSKLKQYLTLSSINWVLCDREALSNVVQLVCVYFKQHTDQTYDEVSCKFSISKCTLGRYLKKGLGVGWITNEEYQKILKSNKKHKVTYVYDLNNNLLGKFASASDLVKISKNKFGIQFSSGGLTNAAKNHTKYHGKYYISYS